MDKPDTTKAGESSTVLIEAIRKLLRPLVRLMLSFQITYPALLSILKSLYVEVAEEDFKVNNKRQSDSRINLLTGVHRKDVKRLRTGTSERQSIPSNISTGARIIGYWLGSEEFQDDNGEPRALELRVAGKPGALPGFDDLVEIVCRQDIRPRVILDEWQNLGIAHLDEDGRVVLNTGAFTPERGFDEKAYFFGKNIQDHISASTHNLLGLKPSYFDRSVYYDKLTLDSVGILAKLADKAGMDALTKVNKRALALQQKDQNLNSNDYRINFGVFNFNTINSSDDKKGDQDA